MTWCWAKSNTIHLRRHRVTMKDFPILQIQSSGEDIFVNRKPGRVYIHLFSVEGGCRHILGWFACEIRLMSSALLWLTQDTKFLRCHHYQPHLINFIFSMNTKQLFKFLKSEHEVFPFERCKHVQPLITKLQDSIY